MSGGVAKEFGMLDCCLGDSVSDASCQVTVIRSFSSAKIKGRVSPPIERRFTTDLSVQPMRIHNRELMMLPEGMRNQERVKAYGVEELKTVETSECRIPDRFIYDGKTYQVEKVGNWQPIGGYYYYEALRVDR